MEYFNDILCISTPELSGIISTENIKKLVLRRQVEKLRRACNNKPALYKVDSFPVRYRADIYRKYGDLEEKADVKPFKDSIEPDPKALQFYSAYRLEDGRALPQKNIQEYCNDASILNALHHVIFDMRSGRSALGGSSLNLKEFWPKAIKAVSNLSNEYPNTLPRSEKRLKDRYQHYINSGYEALVSKKFCNNNSRKVTENIENLLLSLYTLPNKPYGTTVHELYLKFINGQIEVYDELSGELFKKEDFFVNGKVIEISESTVWNYINAGLNRVTVDSKRSGKLEFNSIHRPHHHRHSPNYSFSKISMDDLDLQRKLPNGQRVKVYRAYDVASTAIIGKAYSRDKDRQLFIDCVKDMFRLIKSNDLGMPLEVEVEHHLVNNFAGGLMQAGIIFPFVHWCNPGNSQEKRAEHFNKSKKYGIDKNHISDVGRFFAKLEANRIKTEYGQKQKTYSYDEIVADDIELTKEYNNSLHPNQKKYTGKTRWQVLLENMNPNKVEANEAYLYKYIGDITETSIRRNQYCTVIGCKYQIEDFTIIERLKPNNNTVTAYYLPDNDGQIQHIYLWQGDQLLGKANKITTYNESIAEQTDIDKEAYTNQAKFVSQFDKLVKEGKNRLIKPGILEIKDFEDIDKIQPEIIDSKPVITEEDDMQDFYEYYSTDAIRHRAKEQL